MNKIDYFDTEAIIKVLASGGLVIFPCETVYGIVVDSANVKAVNKLNKYKQRPLGKPYAIMCSDIQMAKTYVLLNKTAKDLYKRFLPGPVTVISKARGKVAKGIESENMTLGVRIPNYPPLLKFIKKFGRPIVASSANTSYKKRPYKISDVFDNISEKQKKLIDLVIDVGELPKNDPSTVMDTTLDDGPTILRQGEIKLKNKNEVLSRSEENTMNVAKELWQKYQDFSGQRAIIYALEGEMGVGKTVFVKGLARAMDIKEQITSPSYDLLVNHELPTPNLELVHIDTWRMIEPNEETKKLGTKKLIINKSIIAIEWADRVIKEIKKYTEDAIIVWVKIKYARKENERLISWGAS